MTSVSKEHDIRIFKIVLVFALVLALKPPYPHSEASPAHINNSVRPTHQAEHKKQDTAATAQTTKQVVQPAKTPETKPKPEPQPQPVLSNRAIGQQMAAKKGWTGDQWLCLEKLWTNESNWRHTVPNYEGSGAYGIPQALPASKMASHGADYRSNPRTQIAWGLDYISARYGTPCGALSFWNSKSPHWY